LMPIVLLVVMLVVMLVLLLVLLLLVLLLLVLLLLVLMLLVPLQFAKCEGIHGGAGKRCQVFGSMGDPLNMNDFPAAQRFGGPLAVVMSPDQTTAAEVRAATAAATGLALSDVHVVPWTGSELRLGTDSDEKDTLSAVFRIAHPRNQTVSDAMRRSCDFLMYILAADR